jgi:hypothetical protein
VPAAAAGAGGRFDHRRVVRHWHSDSRTRQLAAKAVLLAMVPVTRALQTAREAPQQWT